MKTIMKYTKRLSAACLLVLSSTFSSLALAAIDGIPGPLFDLTARVGLVSTPDGDSIHTWGYASGAGLMQYPGPTLIVNQGETVTVTLSNELPVPVSIVFPGQTDVTATGGTPGIMTNESTGTLPAETVTYSFTASNPGTYLYHSGTNPELQVEMGLLGALIVRSGTPNQAYNHVDTAYDYEYLFLLTEIDPEIHYQVSRGRFDLVDHTTRQSVLWMINGRAGPDTMADPFVGWLPYQPYNSLPRTTPGETVLARVINAGTDLHPFHTHGNHVTMIAKDGRLLESTPGAGADIARVDFTIQTVPGQTYDALWSWTGYKLGWDIYGHAPGDPQEPGEYGPDHGKPIPVILPELQETTFGGFYSGSPYLGQFGDLPPGEGGLNLNGGLFFMWHSHNEKELTNNDIFPGGMMTMMIVEPPGTVISN
jgi:FtsP/CotA-like multicopper oxidase with cupredoxin domain